MTTGTTGPAETAACNMAGSAAAGAAHPARKTARLGMGKRTECEGAARGATVGATETGVDVNAGAGTSSVPLRTTWCVRTTWRGGRKLEHEDRYTPWSLFSLTRHQACISMRLRASEQNSHESECDQMQQFFRDSRSTGHVRLRRRNYASRRRRQTEMGGRRCEGGCVFVVGIET